jgi:hypothetical protein
VFAYSRVPTLAVWGGVAGVGALWFLDSVPPVKRDILSRVPFLGARYLPPEESK